MPAKTYKRVEIERKNGVTEIHFAHPDNAKLFLRRYCEEANKLTLKMLSGQVMISGSKPRYSFGGNELKTSDKAFDSADITSVCVSEDIEIEFEGF